MATSASPTCATSPNRTSRALRHRALLPVRQIVSTARSIIRTGQLDARVPVRASDDELDELVRLFNSLLAWGMSMSLVGAAISWLFFGL